MKAFAVAGLTSMLLTGYQQAFDVASIKPSQTARAGGEGSGRERVTLSPTSVTLSNAGVAFAIQWAYKVKFYQVIGPDWLFSERYDMIGKSGRTATKEELRVMMRTLLVERFGLKLHRETRTQPVLKLLAGKNATRLRPSETEQDSPTRVVDGAFVFEHVTLPELAERLSELAAINRPVLDKTGIQGVYDLTLPGAARQMLVEPGSIFAAIEEAGLSLRSGKGPVEILIVDRAGKPSPN